MNIDEKIKKIEDEIHKTSYNKATSHHIGKLKAKISKLKAKSLYNKKSRPKYKGFYLKKSGDSTVVLVGFPSVGKSTLINELTNAESKVGEYQFTTLNIVPGMMQYEGAKIQIFDIPGIVAGASGGKGRGREILSVVRAADLILIVLDVFNPHHLNIVLRELRNNGIRPNENRPNVTIRKKKFGGVQISSTKELTHLNKATIRSIINEYGIHNADVHIRDDTTIDQFIDSLENNCAYVPAIVLLNKIDLANETLLKKLKETIPNFIPISADKKFNINYLKKKNIRKFDVNEDISKASR